MQFYKSKLVWRLNVGILHYFIYKFCLEILHGKQINYCNMYLVEAEEANPGEGGDTGEQDNDGSGEVLDEPEMDPEESGDGKYLSLW